MSFQKHFQTVWDEMTEAGKTAALACKNDWFCGFANVDIAGNTRFGRWAKKTHPRHVHPGYPKGLSIGVYHALEGTPHAGTQSMYVKEEAGRAMAEVLRAHGIQARMTSRAD